MNEQNTQPGFDLAKLMDEQHSLWQESYYREIQEKRKKGEELTDEQERWYQQCWLDHFTEIAINDALLKKD
jgi:hypothetical protein